MANFKENKWTDADDRYVRDNIGRVPFPEMCRHLRRTEKAVRLYILRQRIDVPGPQVKKNLLRNLLEIRFRNIEDFKPSRAFFADVGISSRRYYNIFFGRSQISGEEYARIADYFNITVTECMEARQLSLFE